ncbi:unnamed protein product [Rotaria sp. Silwood1]|nr:unnamed protein product [Rotaria sp. Silwood1]CAF4671230.1 unnamed protein product [Rotaria sp. Silwood1]
MRELTEVVGLSVYESELTCTPSYFYCNNRHIQKIIDSRNSVDCKWLLSKTNKLANIQQTETIMARNLMIEYVNCFETSTTNLSTVMNTIQVRFNKINIE